MGKKGWAIGWLIACLVTAVWAQFQIAAPTTKPTPNAPDYSMPAGKIFINTATLPHGSFGLTTERVKVVCTGAYPTPCGANKAGTPTGGQQDGAFRVVCRNSHMGFEDPIVWPGRPGKTHLHTFFANDTTKSDSDLSNMASVGTSTCDGGLFNRSGYWVPPLVYHCPNAALAGCDSMRNGTVYRPTANNVYYKTGGNPWDLANMVWPPAGLRMIAGNATSTTIQLRHFFACNNTSGTPPAGHGISPSPTSQFGARLPVYTGEVSAFNTCSDITQAVGFRQCLNDGLALDSPDHQSHLVEIDANPAIHPGRPTCTTPGYTVLIPSISYNIHYTVVPQDLDYIRLSSDLPETYGSTQTSADSTHIKLDPTENSTNNYYQWGMLFIGGQGRQVCSYDGTTKIATICSAFTAGTPASGTSYGIRNVGGITTHGDWVNGWDQTTPVVSGGLSVSATILANCLKPLNDCSDNLLLDADPAFPRNNSSTKWWSLY